MEARDAHPEAESGLDFAATDGREGGRERAERGGVVFVCVFCACACEVRNFRSDSGGRGREKVTAPQAFFRVGDLPLLIPPANGLQRHAKPYLMCVIGSHPTR